MNPGQRFGSYRLVTPISRGGMGEVWRAVKVTRASTSWTRHVALKVILPSFADVDQYSEMFVNEAQLAASLTHANIVPVSDFGIHDGVLYLEQELIDGTDLAKIVE